MMVVVEPVIHGASINPEGEGTTVNQRLVVLRPVGDGMKRRAHDADLKRMVVIRSPSPQLVPFKRHRFGKQRHPEVPVTQVEQKAVVEVRNEGLKELEARARSYRFELQEYQSTFAEYCELRTDFPALEATIDNVLRHTCQEYRCLRGRLSAVEEVMRALGRS